MNRSRNPDPLGYLDEVRRALRRLDSIVDLRSSHANSAAYGVVVNHGYCRLYGIEIPPEVRALLEAALSDDVMIAAAFEFARVLQIWRDDAVCLPNRFDGAEPFEDRSLCTGVLHQRMEAWAAFVAIDETYQLRLDGGTGSNELGAAMDRILVELAALDDVLVREEQLRLLSVASELPLLENSRQMLAAPFDEPLPWWLDGSLEAIAQGASREIASENADLLEPEILAFPYAVSLLLRHREENVAQAAEFRIAASAGGEAGPVASDLIGEQVLAASKISPHTTTATTDFGARLAEYPDEVNLLPFPLNQSEHNYIQTIRETSNFERSKQLAWIERQPNPSDWSDEKDVILECQAANCNDDEDFFEILERTEEQGPGYDDRIKWVFDNRTISAAN